MMGAQSKSATQTSPSKALLQQHQFTKFEEVTLANLEEEGTF